jgi:hypothetical protein
MLHVHVYCLHTNQWGNTTHETVCVSSRDTRAPSRLTVTSYVLKIMETHISDVSGLLFDSDNMFIYEIKVIHNSSH